MDVCLITLVKKPLAGLLELTTSLPLLSLPFLYPLHILPPFFTSLSLSIFIPLLNSSFQTTYVLPSLQLILLRIGTRHTHTSKDVGASGLEWNGGEEGDRGLPDHNVEIR